MTPGHMPTEEQGIEPLKDWFRPSEFLRSLCQPMTAQVCLKTESSPLVYLLFQPQQDQQIRDIPSKGH